MTQDTPTPTAGWITRCEGRPIGAGPTLQAAVTDAIQRTGIGQTQCSVAVTTSPATAAEYSEAGRALCFGELTMAEQAMCVGLLVNTPPPAGRALDAVKAVTSAARVVDPTSTADADGLRFRDSSYIELVPVMRGTPYGGRLVRLPAETQEDAVLDEPGLPPVLLPKAGPDAEPPRNGTLF